ncbi:hypothetical protein [Lutimonas zeaxanthinifaciens]|uniref:hypothetical protein n=1 Tax=Lutimonas zeaxanthinifaciens TaxID=3060215 RepID=UPI00265D5EC2|nr:hypothetical protein [Lutimonas sp. YSD2104]WKK67560.1 hypothetical protein QZH61_07995 [Lutimonas sp. YSD2104]
MKLLSFACLIVFIVLYPDTLSAQDRVIIPAQLNKTMMASPGELFASSKLLAKTVQVQILESFEVKSGFTKYMHEKDVKYPLRRAKKGYDLYYANDRLIDGKYWGIGINQKDSLDVISVLVTPEGDMSKQKKYKIENKIERIESLQSCNDCYTQKLIYLGAQNDELKFRYQLLSGVLNKIAKEKEYSFRLQEDTIYECEGLRFSIIDMKDATLEYELLSPFDPI